MAKPIAVRLAGESSSFAFARLDRERLYGRKERQVIDADGRRCSSAWLSGDGAALVPTGGLALLYVDERFSTIERSSLRTVDASGAEVPLRSSTLGVEQELTGPVPVQRLLDHAIHTVYVLTAETLGPQLEAALKAGAIFTAPFIFREDYRPQTLFLVANEHGTFGLVGQEPGFTWVRRETVPAPTPSDSDDLSDDLDFSMM